MKIKYKKDNRDQLWVKLESEIQKRTNKKDKKFVLSGKWKRLLRKQGSFKIFAVDGAWIRNNLCVYFSHGGHGYVHEFIPKNEIWVSTHHYDEGSEIARCSCRVKRRNRKVSKDYFESTVVHEITEFKEMKKGKSYWKAHQIALEKERKLGLLKDPYTD